MSLVNTLQTQSKEDSQKAIFEILNNKAIESLDEISLMHGICDVCVQGS